MSDMTHGAKVGFFVVFLMMVGMAWGVGQQASRTASNKAVQTVEQKLRAIQIAGCIRGKKDRSASARAFRAQSTYLNLVLSARSVKGDVKRAARANQKVQNQSASSLESRTGKNLDCLDPPR